MKQPVHWFLGGLVAAALGLAQAQDQDIAMESATLEQLGIQTARPEMIRAEGGAAHPALVTIPPGQERQVGFTESARVVSYQVALGDSVTRGQSLATVSSPQLLGLQREFLQARLQLSLASQQYQRDRQLESEGIISVGRLQESRVAMDNQRLAAEQQASLLRMNGFDDLALKALERSGRLQTEVSLHAPIDGVVLEISDGVGEMLEAGQPVVRLGDLSSLWLEVRVPLNIADRIVEGAVVALPERGVSGKVERVSRQVDAASQTIVVRARVTEGVDQLRPGEAVEVRMGGEVGESISLPRVAVVHSQQKDWVFLRTVEGFRATEVQAAGTAGDRVLIKSGISADVEVAVRGIAALKGAWMGIGGGE